MIAVDLDRAAVIRDHAVADHQAEPRALIRPLGRKKRIEDLLQDLGCDPAAVVIDVLRAFTVAAMLLDRGASRLVLVDNIDEALAVGHASEFALGMISSRYMPSREALEDARDVTGDVASLLEDDEPEGS